jgi:hypothetical protein
MQAIRYTRNLLIALSILLCLLAALFQVDQPGKLLAFLLLILSYVVITASMVPYLGRFSLSYVLTSALRLDAAWLNRLLVLEYVAFYVFALSAVLVRYL